MTQAVGNYVSVRNVGLALPAPHRLERDAEVGGHLGQRQVASSRLNSGWNFLGMAASFRGTWSRIWDVNQTRGRPSRPTRSRDFKASSTYSLNLTTMSLV